MEIKSWWDRVLVHRKRRRLSNLILRHWKASNTTLKNKLLATYKECALAYNKIKDIIEDIRQFGEIIKKRYGVSKIRQFWQMMYLSFFIGVPVKIYRVYLLYKSNRWKSVRKFTYNNIEPEKEMISMMACGVDSNFQSDYDIFKDKAAFYNMCVENNIPTPTILLQAKLSELSKGELKLPPQDIFIKPIDGARSFGALRLSYHQKGYKDENGEFYDAQKLVSSLHRVQFNSKKDRREFIFQPVMYNHPKWMPFTSGALATCRILTCKTIGSDNIIPIMASFRMPAGNTIADNFSGGGIAAPIQLNNGKLGVGVTYKPKGDSFEFDYHPDTNQKLSGTLLPAWNELLEFTTNVHQKVDFIFVSWDISYTTEGLMVIEGNGLWDIDILESTHNCPLLETRYPELYDKWMEYFAQHDLRAKNTSMEHHN